MENILDEKPVGELNGRLLESVNFIIDSTVKGKRILDIGCGYGWCELELLKRGAAP